jgi:uncharacterized protein
MTIGPWTHLDMVVGALPTTSRESLDWLDAYLGGAPAVQRSAVRVFVNNQGWRDLADWPPATRDCVLYLQPGGGLGQIPPQSGTVPARFRYDPADPTPTTGGPLLSPRGGYRNDTRLASRADVLTFTSATLTEDVCVYGNPVVELAHNSDNPYVDLFIRVSEVDAKGRSRNVSDCYRRLDPGEAVVTLELDATAHRFRAGSRIRVLVTGSWFPRYARNLGTAEPLLTARQVQTVTHSVHFGLSRLVLPVDASPDGVANPGGDLR